jgi:hypothetical protein
VPRLTATRSKKNYWRTRQGRASASPAGRRIPRHWPGPQRSRRALVAAGRSAAAGHALISPHAPNGPRVSRATGARTGALGTEAGHRIFNRRQASAHRTGRIRPQRAVSQAPGEQAKYRQERSRRSASLCLAR